MTTDLNQAVLNVRRYMDAALSVGHTASQYRLTDGSLSFLFHGDLDVILAALSTPPADDVREALIRELHPDYPAPIPALNQLYEDHADRFLSRFDVRPRGTVTEACEWCAEQHNGFAEWQGDDLAHPSCGRAGHGTNFEPARGTVTDADVDAAYRAHEDALRSGENSFEAMRAALEAARGVRS